MTTEAEGKPLLILTAGMESQTVPRQSLQRLAGRAGKEVIPVSFAFPQHVGSKNHLHDKFRDLKA